MKIDSKLNGGFTLVEFLIYSVIVTFLMGSLVLTGINVLQGRARINVAEEVNHNGKLAMNKMAYYIQQAEDINYPAIGNSTSTLSLVISTETVIFDLDEDSLLQMKIGEEDAVALMSGKVEVTSLNFTNVSQSTSTPIAIKTEMTMKFRNPDERQEYTFEREFYATETARIIALGEGEGEPIWACGDDVTFTYKESSVTYGTIENSTTTECWMDRNLGASQVATAYNDANAYGDLFQWGRLDDQHQTRTSSTTSTNSSEDVPGHGDFILEPDSPYDWRVPQKDSLWQGVSGINNPCPSGWRIPTGLEWQNEEQSWSQPSSGTEAFDNLLLVEAGSRYDVTGNIDGGGGGYYWSSTVEDEFVSNFYFDEMSTIMGGHTRASGLSVRCIKD